jgi:phosphate starvation-inducible PhoH-like protein
LEEKFGPWAAPLVEAIKERIGAAAYEIALKNGDIEMVPFEVMRGRSWKDCFVLLDEAQNATPHEMKLFLTRIGEDCRWCSTATRASATCAKPRGFAR